MNLPVDPFASPYLDLIDQMARSGELSFPRLGHYRLGYGMAEDDFSHRTESECRFTFEVTMNPALMKHISHRSSMNLDYAAGYRRRSRELWGEARWV